MLWYKAWRETRGRLTLSALTLTGVCLVIVLLQHSSRLHADAPMTYSSYIWNAVYKDYVRNLFVILVIVLGGGSLLQEKAHGTAGFTLALPVTRARLVAMRAAVGILETVILAAIPALVIPLLSPIVGESFPLSQSLRFAILWAACGVLFWGSAQLLSTQLGGEYSAWIVCFLTLILYASIVNMTALQNFPQLDFFKIMSGARMPYFNSTDHLLTGPLPWKPLGVVVGIGCACIAASSRAIERQDY